MKFELGHGLKCDLQKLIDSRALIQANSGGGKSWILRRLLEQTHGRVQQIVLDPEGEFASLRQRFDYVLAAKSGGDTAADPRAAKLLAERLLELGVSAICDIYELKAHQRIQFVRHFLEAMVDAPKTLWHPALVVVDEAHVFCPQQGEAESAAAVIDLATRGRKRGFSAILATQRLSKLHKDAAAELNNKLIGRTGLDVDRKRAGEELGFTTKEQLLSLRQLEPGHFYAFGPALSLEVVQVEVGPVQTTHPKAGSRIAFTPPPPTDKVKALLPQLADLPAEAEQKQRTEAELKKDLATARATITRLERAPLHVESKVETKVERVAIPMLTEEHLKALRAAAITIQATFAGARGLVEKLTGDRAFLTDALKQLDIAITKATKPVAAPRPVQAAGKIPHVSLPARQIPPATVMSPSDGEAQLATAQRKILNALAFLEQVGYTTPDRTQVSLFAGLSPTAGHTSNMYGGLRTAGLIEYLSDGKARLTDGGRALADPGTVPQTAEEMQTFLLGRVASAQRKILTVLIAEYPNPIDRREAAERAGLSPDAGHTSNMFGGLRSLGIIDYPSPKTAVALPVLFLEGAA